MMEKPENVVAACAEDADGIFDLLMLLYEENAPFALNLKKVRRMIDLGARDNKCIIGVIKQDGIVVASVGALFEQWWHTDDWHIGEMWNFVHPNYRKTTYANDLIDYMKWIAEKMEMSLHMGIITATKLEAKTRLYRRKLPYVGSLFIYNIQAAGGPLADNAAAGKING